MNIESNALLVPNATSVPSFPRFRVNCCEVAPCAKLGPENMSFMDRAVKVKCMFSPTDFLVDISPVASPCKTGWPVSDHVIIVLLQPQSVLCSYPGHEADSIRGYHGVQALNIIENNQKIYPVYIFMIYLCK